MARPDFAAMSESERWEYVGSLIKEGKGPSKGRPRKDGSTVTWKDVGITRTQAFKWRQLARVPQEVMDAHIAQRKAKGKRVSTRGFLIAGGVIENVSDENIFEGSGIDEIAQNLLKVAAGWFERSDSPAKVKKWVIRAMVVELRKMRYAIDE
jgi:hypothetical protein